MIDFLCYTSAVVLIAPVLATVFIYHTHDDYL